MAYPTILATQEADKESQGQTRPALLQGKGMDGQSFQQS